MNTYKVWDDDASDERAAATIQAISAREAARLFARSAWSPDAGDREFVLLVQSRDGSIVEVYVDVTMSVSFDARIGDVITSAPVTSARSA